MDAEAVRVALAPEALAPPIAKELNLPVEAVQSGLALLAEGAQPAFVARYRRERTASLSIRDLERIQAAAARAAAFEFRRQDVRAELERRSLYEGHVAQHVQRARHPIDLEDLKVLSRKRKRGGPAAKARAGGLASLADALWREGSTGFFARRASSRKRRTDEGAESQPEAAEEATTTEAISDSPEPSPAPENAAPEPSVDPTDATVEEQSVGEKAATPDGAADPLELARGATSEAFPTADDALAGARAICAELIADAPTIRAKLRKLLLDRGKIHTRVVESKKDKASKYARFFDRAEPCKGMAVSNILAVHRAEREGLLTIDIEIDPERVRDAVRDALRIDPENPAGQQLLQAVDEAWTQGLSSAVEGGVRKLIKQRADRQAIVDLTDAFRPLLLAPALGPVPVLGIDPGQQSGCRIAVVDGSGTILADDSVYPLQPKLQAPQAKARIIELCRAHGVRAIAVGTASGGREVERLCREALRDSEGCDGIAVVSVDSDIAALGAATRKPKKDAKDAKAATQEEGPADDAAVRRAVSLARRVQDPLAELSKIDSRKLGLGQYQHEVDPEELRSALEQVLSSCTNEVTLDVNTASIEQLARIAGLSQALAKALLAQRETNGPFRSRQALLDVPGVAGKAFEQCSGFLRVMGGDQPLDETCIHPERYGQVTQMARDLGVTVPDLLGNAELVDKIDVERHLGQPGLSGEPLGRATMDDLLEELRHPGRDPRPPFVSVEFDSNLRELSDLRVGMELEGIVTHLAGFGAFVDVGLPQEGLVHVSELSHEFVKSPLEAVHVGQKVRGRVIEIAPERKRFALSLKALQPRPERKDAPPRRPRKGKPAPGEGAKAGSKGERGERGERGKPRGKGKGPRDREADRGKKQRSDRTLGFRLDLSELAERLEKGR